MTSSVCPRIRLRAVAPGDHGVLRDLRTDPEVQRMLLGNPEPGGDPDVTCWIARREAAGRLWAIADGASDACLGFVQLADVHRRNANAWLGIALARECRGRGVGRAAMQALEIEARGMGLRKLLLQVRADNRDAIALYERLGYRHAGLLRTHYDDGARRHDVTIMERLLDEAP